MRYFELKNEEGMRGRHKIKVQQFDSITDFREYLAEAQPNSIFRNERQQSVETRYNEFYGTDSYEEAERIFKEGWTKVSERITKAIKTPLVSANAPKSKPTYGLVGGQASVPRYIQGIPTSMIDRKPVQQQSKIIVINKCIGFHAGVTTEQIIEEGIKALKIIQFLESKGYRVKLNTYWFSKRNYETVGQILTLKKPEERISVSKLAFPIAHPSMLRRIGFKWMESFPTMTEKDFVGGYGRVNEEAIYKVLGKGTKEIILPSFIPDVDAFLRSIGH